MDLSEISAALQRGEALTAVQKFYVREKLAGKVSETGTIGEWDWYVSRHGDPFTSVDAALAFVAEVFPDFKNSGFNFGVDGSGWSCAMWSEGELCIVTAPTPSAAIMAACIEAHLAKGGE